MVTFICCLILLFSKTDPPKTAPMRRFRDYEFNQVWSVHNSRFVQQDIPVLLFANQAYPAYIHINPLAAVSAFLITYFLYRLRCYRVRFYRTK